jgi:hypothetical protein
MNRNPLLVAILAALSGCDDAFDGTACMPLREMETDCPLPDHFEEGRLLVEEPDPGCDTLEIVDVTGKGRRADRASTPGPRCCYPVKLVRHDGSCGSVGRPYYDAGQAVLAPLRTRPEREGQQLSEVAAAWARAGAAEHASVAAFARLALELMALGAPNDLLRGVHQAAMDEVGHADMCWALAKHNGASEVCAGEFPIRDLKLSSSLAALAASAVREGCLAETLGAQAMTAIAALAPDPAVRATITTIGHEEVTHAVLSFRIVAWALKVGGAGVRTAVRSALAEPWPELDTEELALRAGVSPALVAEVAARAVTDVLAPAAARLLAA